MRPGAAHATPFACADVPTAPAALGGAASKNMSLSTSTVGGIANPALPAAPVSVSVSVSVSVLVLVSSALKRVRAGAASKNKTSAGTDSRRDSIRRVGEASGRRASAHGRANIVKSGADARRPA
jgi:hypothetical protein